MSWHRDYALPPVAAVVENSLLLEDEPGRFVREELMGFMGSNRSCSSPRQPHVPEPQPLDDSTHQATNVGNPHMSLPAGTHASSYSMDAPHLHYPVAYHHYPMVEYSNPAQRMPVMNPRKRRRTDDIDDDGLVYTLARPSGPPSVYGQAAGGTLVQHDDLDMVRLPARPLPKRGRTRVHWTPAEERLLNELRGRHLSWAEIGKYFLSRSEGSVKKHWYRDMRYTEFADDHRLMLLHALRDYEVNKWKVIGQAIGKPAKACEIYCRENFSKDQIAGKIKDVKTIALRLPTLEEAPEEGV